jgi:enamine deaminase RidA (YjgF/YER057c/UK114 family)
MSKHVINPPELFNSLQYGFSQIVVSTGTRQVHISGQVAWDANEQIVGKGDLAAQTIQSFKNLDLAMQKAGGTLADIISLRIYISESVINETRPVREGLHQFFPDNPPASTWIGVPSLANDEFLIEIEAFAVLE